MTGAILSALPQKRLASDSLLRALLQSPSAADADRQGLIHALHEHWTIGVWLEEAG